MDNLNSDNIIKIEEYARKIFSPKNSSKLEVFLEPDLLSIRIFKRKDINPWFSLIEIKRFHDKCSKEKVVNFLYSWEFTSFNLENSEFFEIYFHISS